VRNTNGENKQSFSRTTYLVMSEQGNNSRSALITDNAHEDLAFQRKSQILSALSELVYKEINNLKFELLVCDTEYRPSSIRELQSPCFTISNLLNLSHKQSDHECYDLQRDLINETKSYLLQQFNEYDALKKAHVETEVDVDTLTNIDGQTRDDQTVNLFANSFLVELIDDSLSNNTLLQQCNDNNNNVTISSLVEHKEEIYEDFSSDFSEKIIHESFERIFQWSLYAQTFVDELFHDFYQTSVTSNQTNSFKLMTDQFKETDFNLSSQNSSALAQIPNSPSVNDSSSSSIQINDSNQLRSLYRRHSADLSRFINSITGQLSQTSKAFVKYANPLSTIAARRHSFNTFETSYKMRFEHFRNQMNLNESDNSSSQSCIDANSISHDKNVYSSSTNSASVKSRSRMFRTSCSSAKKPIVTVLSDSTTTVDSQNSDLFAQMPLASSTNQITCLNTSSSNVSSDTTSTTTSKVPFIQYAKVTLKNIFTPSTNKASKLKSTYSSSSSNSQPPNSALSPSLKAFVNEFSNEILNSAFNDVTLLNKY